MEVRFDGPPRRMFRRSSVPPVYDICKTVDMLATTDKSFSRFGDGEFKMMVNRGVDHLFQKRNAELSDRLTEILASDNGTVEVGVNRIYFYKDGFESPYIEDFIHCKGYGLTMLRDRYLEYMRRDHYYDSVFSVPVHHYNLPSEWFRGYFERVKGIWSGKRVCLVTGDTAMMDYSFNIVTESARSVELVEVSKVNAFDYHRRIMSYVKRRCGRGRDSVILLACGLAATVLAYDLGSEGYRAIDIGHLPREYDAFMRGVRPHTAADKGFFGS